MHMNYDSLNLYIMQNNQELEMYSSLLIILHSHVCMLTDSIIIILVAKYHILQIV